jgi:hypothetical protein
MSHKPYKTTIVKCACGKEFKRTSGPKTERCPKCRYEHKLQYNRAWANKLTKGRRVFARPHPEAEQYDFNGNMENAIYC